MDSEPTLSPRWLRAVLLSGLAMTLAVVVWRPILEVYPRGPWGDGEYFQHMIEATQVSLRRYHELPLWMAYDCGGAPMWDNPEGTTTSPLVLLTIGLPSMMVKILWYLSHVAAGFVSMWLFARHEFSLSRMAAFVASCLWAFGVAHSSQYAGGHDSLVAFLYMPLVLLLWRRAETNVDMAVLLGLLFGWMFYDGATYPVPHFALLLGAESLTRAWPLRRVAAMARAGVVVAAVGFCAGAPRLLPIVDQFAHHHRIIPEDVDHLARWSTLRDMYLAKTHSWVTPGQQYVWGEYIAYIGHVVLVLAVVGVLVSGVRNVWFLALGAFVFLMMLGKFSPHAPWKILQEHVFPFSSMRVPARFRLILAGFIAVYAAMAIDRVPELVAKYRGRQIADAVRIAVAAIALLGAGDVLATASDVIASKFGNTAPHEVAPSARLYYEGPGLAAYVDQPRQNRGRLACEEHWVYTASAPTWPGDVPQARAADGAAVVEVANRTQNTFTMDIVASRPARVLVNSGYDRGWRTDVGTLSEDRQLLVLDVPAGRHRVHLWYWPHGLTAGFVFAALGVPAAIAFLMRRRLARWPHAARLRAAWDRLRG